MLTELTRVESLSPLGHDRWMGLASQEYDRLLELLDGLADSDFESPTDCPDWDVRAMLGHMLGHLRLQADAEYRTALIAEAAQAAARTGGLRIDALTAIQVEQFSGLTLPELRAAFREMVPVGIAARTAMPQAFRDTPYDPELPGEAVWTFGYLFDVVHTRDPWLHRVDICRATDRPLLLTPEHDGLIVADVVRDWAARLDSGVTLTLSGPAGGRYLIGDGATPLELDAVEFCRVLSGRGRGTGPLATRVTF